MSSDDTKNNFNETRNNSNDLIQEPILTYEERLSKIRGIIEAFESGDLKLMIDDSITSDDTPVMQYLKAQDIIHGGSLERDKARVKVVEDLSRYERIILGMVKASPEQITDAINNYYNLFSTLRKLGKIKGTFASFNQKEKIKNIENRLDGFETELNNLKNSLDGLRKDSGI